MRYKDNLKKRVIKKPSSKKLPQLDKKGRLCIGHPDFFVSENNNYQQRGKLRDGHHCLLFRVSGKIEVHKHSKTFDFVFRDKRYEKTSKLGIEIGSKSSTTQFIFKNHKNLCRFP